MSDYVQMDDDILIRLRETEHGVALSVEWWEPDVLPDEPRSGSTVYLSKDQINGMAKWLGQHSESPLPEVGERERLRELVEKMSDAVLDSDASGRPVANLYETWVELRRAISDMNVGKE